MLELSSPLRRCTPWLVATLEIFPLENKKNLLGPTYTQNRTKKRVGRAKEQLLGQPRNRLFLILTMVAYWHGGQYYMILPLRSPGFSDIVTHWHCMCMRLRHWSREHRVSGCIQQAPNNKDIHNKDIVNDDYLSSTCCPTSAYHHIKPSLL